MIQIQQWNSILGTSQISSSAATSQNSSGYCKRVALIFITWESDRVTPYTPRKSNIISGHQLTSSLFFSLISCLFNCCKQLSAHHLFEQPNQNNYKCMLHYNNCILTKAWGQLIITPSISNLHKAILFKDSMFGVTGLPHWLCKFSIKLCRKSQKK